MVLPGSDGILAIIDEGNRLFGLVKSSREAALDTELLTVVAQIAVEQSQRLAGGTHYDLETFIKNSSKMIADSEGKEFEEKLTSFSNNYCQESFKTTVKRSFLYGPLQKEFQKKVVKPRAPKEKLGKKVTPQNIKDTKFDEQTETSLRVEHVGNVLREVTADGTQSINFWDLVLDPESFSKTAENIFHFSFLVKEGYAKIDDENNIVPSAPANTEVENLSRHQAIIRLDYEKWEEIKNKHNRSEATIPTFEAPSRPSQKTSKSSQSHKSQKSSQKPSQKSQSKKRKHSSSSSS
uniref:Non-structural maintenance of chromosomes element 4 n=1 Tax=Arcella intermedia TaxID=1963864 RepID=A0A6B2L8J5_9EUKA